MTDRSALVNLPALPRGCRGGGCVVSAAPRRRIRGVDIDSYRNSTPVPLPTELDLDSRPADPPTRRG